MKIVTIYVLYSMYRVGQVTVEKWQLVSEESFRFSIEVAKEMGRIVTLVHNDSTVITDPILELAIVSDTKIEKTAFPEINQRAINWLVDTGYGMTTKSNIEWNLQKMEEQMKKQ